LAEIAYFDFILGELPESIIQGKLFIAELEGRSDEMGEINLLLKIADCTSLKTN
jgi:hypothetical protein